MYQIQSCRRIDRRRLKADAEFSADDRNFSAVELNGNETDFEEVKICADERVNGRDGFVLQTSVSLARIRCG